MEKKNNGDIKIGRKYLNILERGKKVKMRKRTKTDQLQRKYQIKEYKLITIIKELNQKLVANAERDINNRNDCLSKNRRSSRAGYSN